VVSGGLFVWLGHLAGTKLGSIEEMRAKIKGVEHWVILGAIVVVGGFLLWMWTRKKSDKPKLADVALEKAAEKAHQRHDAAMASVQPDAPVAPPTTTQVREPQPPV
jgi:hypothetical protein